MTAVNAATYTYTTATASTTAAKKQFVAATTGSRHRIIGLIAAAAAAQVITLQSSTGGVLLGPVNLAAGVPLVLPPSLVGYAETAASRGIFNQSGNATETALTITYQTYDAT
jgi:hypothetical protein